MGSEDGYAIRGGDTRSNPHLLTVGNQYGYGSRQNKAHTTKSQPQSGHVQKCIRHHIVQCKYMPEKVPNTEQKHANTHIHVCTATLARTRVGHRVSRSEKV